MRGLIAKLTGRASECDDVRALLSDFVDDELEQAGKARVEEHVGICPQCRKVLANLRYTLDWLHLLSDRPPPGVEAEDEVVERISSSWRERL